MGNTQRIDSGLMVPTGLLSNLCASQPAAMNATAVSTRAPAYRIVARLVTLPAGANSVESGSRIRFLAPPRSTIMWNSRIGRQIVVMHGRHRGLATCRFAASCPLAAEAPA